MSNDLNHLNALNYQHRLNGEISSLPVGKIICVGRNYIAHAKELNNPVPSEPILFIKSANTLVEMSGTFAVPADRGACHFETELALLMGEPVNGQAANGQPINGKPVIAGIGLAYDLTLRDVQQQLKDKGHPWEKAKSFNGACPVSEFVTFDGDLQSLSFQLWKNGNLQQDGHTKDMITPVAELLSYIEGHFHLQAGDIVLTGTPAGVGPLMAGDQLVAQLTATEDALLRVESTVI